jgi:hypothetical protein
MTVLAWPRTDGTNGKKGQRFMPEVMRAWATGSSYEPDYGRGEPSPGAGSAGGASVGPGVVAGRGTVAVG